MISRWLRSNRRQTSRIASWHAIPSSIETIYQRDYEVYAPDMRRLYENAKRDQWNDSRDVDWSAPVDPDRGVFHDGLIDAYGSPYWEKLDLKRRRELNIEFSAWRLSQLLHGESGAMIACSQLVQMVPTTDSKFFMTTQVVDEARHAEVLARYLKEKLGNKVYPMTTNLKSLFDQLIGSGKWYIKTIGLQLVAETLVPLSQVNDIKPFPHRWADKMKAGKTIPVKDGWREILNGSVDVAVLDVAHRVRGTFIRADLNVLSESALDVRVGGRSVEDADLFPGGTSLRQVVP